MFFEYLRASRLHLIDCEISGELLKAGWVWVDRGIGVDVLPVSSEDGYTLNIKIPKAVKNTPIPTPMFFKNDTVDFYIDR